VLEHLKKSVERMREMTKVSPGAFGTELLEIADQIANDATVLEAELIISGDIPRAGV
jgi:hypothetical protein